MEFLNRFIDRSLKLPGLDYRRRSRILLDVSLAVLIFNLVVTLTLFGPLHKPQLAWATLVILMVGVTVLPALRYTGSVSIAGNILLSQTWALLHVLTLYTGKIQGVPPAWIIFLPILAIHICNKGSGLVWTVLATGEIFTVAWLAFRSEQLTGGSLMFYLTTHLGLLSLMVTTAYLNERFKERTLARLSKVNADLSIARDRALEANRAKGTFVANMSHELRTPLNAVIGYSEILVEDAGAVEPEQMKKDLQRIKASGQHLLRLINELLEFSSLESGRQSVSLESFRPELLVEELVMTMEQQALANENTLVIENALKTEGLQIVTDPTKYRQCLYNLLSNACKFTKQGEIVVRLSARTESIVVEVEDSGIGMTSEQLERVFEPFVQAEESISRRFGGTGLGLSLSRRLAEVLGGSLMGHSTEGEGSRFVLTVPLNSKGA